MVQPEKSLVVEELKERLQTAATIFLTDYRGLKVGELQELSGKLRSKEMEHRVIKNNLAKIALEQLGLEDLVQYLEGPTAIVFGSKDPVETAKILVNFGREHEELKIKIGLLEGETLGREEIFNLAALPSREVLLSRVVGGIGQPLRGLVNVLISPLRNLICILKNIEERRNNGSGEN